MTKHKTNRTCIRFQTRSSLLVYHPLHVRVSAMWPLAFISAALAIGQVPSQRPNETATPSVPPKSEAVHNLTSDDLTAFLDGLLTVQLDRSDEAGAVVFVMRDHDVLVDKGYGYSDVEKRTAVDPRVSGFRPGSISKLFTWISVMQLKEQGRLNLDADVNQYLDFRIRARWSEPLTLRDLMTHRPGFEETLRDLIVKFPAKPIPLRQYLVENQPNQAFPPGDIPAYSNYGAGLAGYIVEHVSGEPYEQYVRNHIFDPLGMNHSSFGQPLPESWPVHPVRGYGTAENKMLPFEVVSSGPAGALTTTGADMIRFADALMHGGQLDGRRILQTQTLEEMWTRQYAANPALPGICLGFYEQWRNGNRWVGHGGDVIAYHSQFLIQPESKTALFVSYNTAGPGRGTSIERTELFNDFVDRYFGPAKDLAIVAKGQGTAAKDVVGAYWSTRRGIHNRLKLLSFMGQNTVSADQDGNVVVSDSKSVSGETIHWKPAGQDLWVDPQGQRHLAAIRDANGRVVRLAGDFPAIQLQRVPWYARASLNRPLVIASLAILICVVWAGVLRLIQRKRLPTAVPPLRRLRRVQVLMSLVWLALAGFLFFLASQFNGPAVFPPSHKFDTVFAAITIWSLLAIVLSVWMLARIALTWSELPSGLWSRIPVSAVALAAVFLIWFSFHWKLVGVFSHY